ncbi:hypothetical protein AG1IA_06771 [Rhizoctonia solani AG-1 IA]|uniref:Uncharacterized protein n=1 Tax=Thanatephorus cucumeris (strain AG1-IA) TaxID=983506 RepID=L8WLZ7_THACA|nr:hypothetical protein AG1IA_06771 [Rhizoctonia solani AG-1 IA]
MKKAHMLVPIASFLGIHIEAAPIDGAINAIALFQPVVGLFKVSVSEETFACA